MTRRDDSKAETRELILEAAKSLFWEMGPEKCTIRSIANEAGVSAATIIVHFKNKTALLEAVLSKDIGKTLADTFSTMPQNCGLQVTLVKMATAMLSLYANNRELYKVLIRDTYFEPCYNSPTISKLDNEYLPIFAAMIDKEKEAGKIRKEIDSLLAAHALFSLYIGQVREFLRSPEMTIETTLSNMESILDLVLKGFYTQGSQS